MCQEEIPAGEEAIYCSGRVPTYDENEEQDGIEYINYYEHTHNCTMPESCKNGNHEWKKEMVLDHYVGAHKVGAPTGRTVCIRCGKYKQQNT